MVIFCSLNISGNVMLSLEGFKPWVQGERKGLPDENVQKIFKIFNKAHNNVILEIEYLQACTDSLDIFPPLSCLMPQIHTSKMGHEAAGPYVAGTWAQGSSSMGQF